MPRGDHTPYFHTVAAEPNIWLTTLSTSTAYALEFLDPTMRDQIGRLLRA
jgi:hypothetical protein